MELRPFYDNTIWQRVPLLGKESHEHFVASSIVGGESVLRQNVRPFTLVSLFIIHTAQRHTR